MEAKPLFAILLFVWLILPISADDYPSPTIAPLTTEELMGNVSTSLITVPQEGLLYTKNVDPSEEFIAIIETSSKSLSGVVCIPQAKKKSCNCSVLEPKKDVRCAFGKPPAGIYRINLESSFEKAIGNFTMELTDGMPPTLRQEVRQETIPLWLLQLALSFAAISLLSYAIYFLYKFSRRKKDALNSLYEQRNKVEDDMKVLRYRFFKREIDNPTYNSLFQQKENELAVVNDKIVLMLKTRQKRAETTDAADGIL